MPPIAASAVIKKGAKIAKSALRKRERGPLSHSRGIRNAMVRYRDSIEKRSLVGTIGRHEYLKQKSSPSSRRDRKSSSEATYTTSMQEVYARAQEIYRNANESIEERDLEETVSIKMQRPPEAPFPFIILALAIIKDLFDVLANLIMIGIPVSIALSAIITLVLFFWTLGKMSGGWWKKRLIRWMLTSLIILYLGESTPFLQVLPIATIFVLMAHYRERKAVKLFNQVLEELRAAKLV